MIAVGDFNVPRDSWLFEGFQAASGPVPTPSTATPPRMFLLVPGWNGAALDQVLVTPGVLAKAEVVMQGVGADGGRAGEWYLSDHYGVAATKSGER